MPLAPVGDYNIYYEIHGNGEPLIVLSGWAVSLLFVIPRYMALAEHFQLIFIDTRGTGYSSPIPKSYKLIDHEDDILAVMDYLGIQKASIMGNSMGGMLAMELMLRYPERIDKTILINTTAKMGSFTQRLYLCILTAWSYWDTPVLFISKLVNALGFHPEWAFNIQRFNGLMFLGASSEAIVNDFRQMMKFNIVEQLKAISHRILIIVGKLDRIATYEKHAKVLKDNLVNAEMVTIPDGRHNLYTANASQIIPEVVRFLK
jgi:3-oxoadipate enol-lactonase